MARVLIIGTGRKTRGGITSVIKAHETGEQWKKYHCFWIQTHRDGNTPIKLWYFSIAIIQYLILLPFTDIVHFHFSEETSARRKSLLMPIAKFFRKKIIAHFHAFSLDSTIRGRFKKKYQYLFSNADISIVLSEYWRRALVEELKIPKEKVKILYNPCPIVISKDSNGIFLKNHIKNKEILYAGTVNHRKGYDDMIRAFAQIAPRYPDWKIVFAGNGEIEQGKALAANLGITGQTVFLGWITGTDKDKAFKSASIFCLPSYAEGFPMGVLDAWAYGLPVITTPVGGLPDIAIHGKNVLLFNPGDINNLAVQMEAMISNEELRKKISKESTQLAQTTFNITNINKQLEDIYKKLL